MADDRGRTHLDARTLHGLLGEAPIWYRTARLARIAASRLRASRYRLLGAKLGPKCLLDRGSRLEYPWRIQIGERSQLEPDVWFKLVSPFAEVSVGEYSFLGRGLEIDVVQKVTMGAHVLIAPGVFITDHIHDIAPNVRIDEQGTSAAPVSIGDDVWLGAGAIVLPGVTIGAGSVVGAGAVVRGDVAPSTVVAGVPARVVRRR
jgi:carbonic anhydrase/acetyltransferase-like protein (isoleucine patch superfamily)